MAFAAEVHQAEGQFQLLNNNNNNNIFPLTIEEE
jgi:hypothetical protein